MVRFRVLAIFVLPVVAATGVVALWTPFGVDQAIFVYGGQTLVSQHDLYREFWDIKPPGIFVFYGLGGLLAGFDEPGIHTVELVWQLILAGILLWIAWLLAERKSVAALAPLLSLGCYWIWGRAPHLTQVEALVGLPVAGSLLLTHSMSQRPAPRPQGILLGVCLGAITALKPVYLLFPFAFIMLAAVMRRLQRPQRLSSGSRVAVGLFGWMAAGWALVWIPLVAYFTLQGSLAEMLRTTFLYPREVLREIAAAPPERLRSSVIWCARVFAPSLPLLLAGIWTVLRRSRRSFLVAAVGLYLLLAVVVILVQKASWWEYHFVLLFPPLGLLAALGLDRIATYNGLLRLPPAVRTLVVLGLLTAPAIDLGSGLERRLAELRRARALTTTAPLPVRLDPDYLKIWEKTEFLREPGGAREGSIYVFGDFRLLLASGRRQAIAARGHAWQHLPKRLWDELPRQLIEAEPVFIFVGGWYRKEIRQNSPWLWRQIQNRYRPVRRHRSGRWYQLRNHPPPVTAPPEAIAD